MNVPERIYDLPLVDDICYYISKKKLFDWMDNEANLDSIFNTAYNYDGYGLYSRIEPNQHSEEFKELVDIISKISPSTIMEIGTDLGGVIYVFGRHFDDANILSLDIRNSKRREFFELFGGDQMRILEGNSHNIEIKEQVESVLDGDKIDFLLIDGDHSYEGVKEDFHMYGPLVRDGGIIAFHDITERPDGAWFDNGVNDFWDEIKTTYNYEEIMFHSEADFKVENNSKQERIEEYAGIGVIYK